MALAAVKPPNVRRTAKSRPRGRGSEMKKREKETLTESDMTRLMRIVMYVPANAMIAK
jgi:hypothetical protein